MNTNLRKKRNRETADRVIESLTMKYQPDGIILYGSFSDGSAAEDSDFDALLIAGKTKLHDTSVIEGTVMDVFVYPPETFRKEYDPAEFVQIAEGNILLDKSGMAEALKEKVREYIAELPLKDEDAVSEELAWCEKMLRRTRRQDAEGYYRWHWLLTESLEIYADIRGIRYPGPKKTLRFMAKDDPVSFRICKKALQQMRRESLEEWIAHLWSLPLHE